MKVHLLRSAEYAEEKYSDVLDLLQRVPGPIRFIGAEALAEIGDEELEAAAPDFDWMKKAIPSPESVATPAPVALTNWSTIFQKCRVYRKVADVGDAEAVVLLTEHGNENNWFSSGNPKGGLDFFVQTSQWDFFMGSDQRFPVAYLVAAEILQNHLFPNFKELVAHVHQTPRGCVFDFCGDKRDIRVPMRCADLCAECIEAANRPDVEGSLIQQALSIMEVIRASLLFKERFEITLRPSRLSICGESKKIVLDDLGDLEVRLLPMEKAVYLFFLHHPEGVSFNELSDFEDELLEIYESVSGTHEHATNLERIGNLVNPAENTIHENIARIKRKFIEAVGEKMTKDYVITGPRAGKRRIQLDRSLVHERAD